MADPTEAYGALTWQLPACTITLEGHIVRDGTTGEPLAMTAITRTTITPHGPPDAWRAARGALR